MADFFTRMAERALGLAPVAVPDLPSMFTPAAPPLELSSDIIAPRENSTSRALATPSVIAAGRSEKAPTDRPTQAAMEVARQGSEGRPSTAKANAQVRSESDQRVHAAEESAESWRLGRRGEISPTPPATVASARAHGFDSRGFTQARDEFTRQALESPIMPTIRNESGAASIHVSIGRVEVRAVTAPTPQPRARERKAAPLRPLDQYLRDRNEGRR